jgi:transcriptional regulator with GAF, ATPase, and Fis domain
MTGSPLAKARARHNSEARRLLLAALKRNAWNVGATARELKMWVTTLRRAIATHGISAQLEKHGHGAGRPRKEKS